METLLRSILRGPARRVLILLAYFLFFLISPHVWAATQNAVVTGYVYDANGAAIPGATVRLINPGTGFSQARNADANGSYTFPSVPPASGYLLSVEMNGFTPAFHADLEINVGDYKDIEPPFILQPVAAAPAPTPAPAPSAVTPAAPTAQPTAPAAPAAAPTPPQPTVTAKVMAPPRGARATQTPTVSLDLGNTMMGGVIDSRMTRTLPLENRDFFALALLVTGTYPVQQGSPLEGASLVVNGVRANMNNFLLDGVDNNDYTINQALPFQIVEAMQEFRVQTSASTAEYGRGGGGQVNTISRIGANTFHGDIFGFNRNSALNGQQAISAYSGGTFNAFADSVQTQRTEFCGTGAPNACYWPNSVMSDAGLSSLYNKGLSPYFNENQFGGNLGGPIAKNRAFFFFNWESLRADDPRPDFERVPDSTCRTYTACNNYITSQGYVGLYSNGPSAIDASNLLGFYPLPNVPASTVVNEFGTPVSDPQHGDLQFLTGANAGYYDTTGAFYTGQAQNFTNSDGALGRIDIRASDRVSMSFKHNIQRINQVQGGSIAQTPSYPGNGITVNGRNQNFSFNLVDTLTDRTVNEFRAGWNRFRLDTLPVDHTINASSIFHNIPSGEGLPLVIMGGFEDTTGPYASLGAGFAAPSNRANSLTSAADSLSLTRGRHIIKFGAEVRHDRLNVGNEGAGRGLFTFTSPLNVNFQELMGVPNFASIARVSPAFGGGPTGGGFDRSFQTNAANAFVQDTWRIQSDLTLTIGLRYEVNQAPLEERNRLVNNYPYTCTNTATGLSNPVCLHMVGDPSGNAYDGLGNTMGASTITPPLAGFNTDLKDFGPHIGIAWAPGGGGKTVFRAGYAMMYDQMSLQPSVNMLLNPPMVEQTSTLDPLLGDTFPAGFPLNSTCAPASGITATPNCWGGAGYGLGYFNLSNENYNGSGFGTEWYAQPYSITSRDPNTRTPYVHQVYAGVEQRLGNKAMFEVAYVGALGHRLLRDRLLLDCPASVLDYAAIPHGSTYNTFTGACFPEAFGTPGPSIFYYGSTFGTDSDSVINQETSGASGYNSLQARLDTRAFHGLTLHVHYMWAHSIDNASSTNPPVFLLSPTAADTISFLEGKDPSQLNSLNNANPTLSLRPGFPTITTQPDLPSDSQNSADLSGQRASSDFDIRHRAVIYYAYDVPKVASLRGLGNGWQVAGITTLQSGQPFSVYGDFFGVPLRPNLVGSAQINNSNPSGAIDNAVPAGCNNGSFGSPCYGTSAKSPFTVTPSFAFENGFLPRNSFIGPRFYDFDFSVLKNVYLGKGENKYLQFRAEFFNLFNRANYRQPDGNEGQFVENPCPGVCSGSSFAVSNPFFGQILQTFDPRTIQFGAKFIF
jgi:hypothetical protein